LRRRADSDAEEERRRWLTSPRFTARLFTAAQVFPTISMAAQVLLTALAVGDDTYEPCPAYPPLAPAASVAAEPQFQAALRNVTSLLQSKAATLPSGLVATIVYNDSVLWSGGFGLRDKNKPGSGPPLPSDLVRIASITKAYTDTLLYVLRDAGTVGLDDELATHLPGFSMRNPYGTAGKVTLRNLASHLAGIPREMPWPCTLDQHQCAESDVLENLRSVMPVSPPNRRFHYSNLGIALLGRALAHAAAATSATPPSFEALLAEKVLAPLGMVNATFDTAKVLAANQRAVGTTSSGEFVNVSNTCQPTPGAPGGWGAPCGCLWASADDMAKFIQLYFRDGVPAGASPSQILDGDTLREALLPSVLLRDGSSAVGTPWEVKYSSGVWMKGKQGELPGYRSSVTLVEELKLGRRRRRLSRRCRPRPRDRRARAGGSM